MILLSDQFHGICSFILLVSATALNLASGSPSSQLQRQNTLPALLPVLLFPQSLPFPFLKYNITPSTYSSTQSLWATVTQHLATNQTTSEFTWGACKRAGSMLALTNPRMSRIGATGLCFPRTKMLVYSIVWNPTPRQFLTFAALIPSQPPEKGGMAVQWPKAHAGTKVWLEACSITSYQIMACGETYMKQCV